MEVLKYITEKRKLLFTFLLFLAISSDVFAVTYTMGTSGSQSATITATSGAPDKFYDDGGSGSNYSDGISSVSYTFNCAGGKYVRLKINDIIEESNLDYLYFYDGATTGDRLIGETGLTGTYSTDFMVVSTTGSITIKFTSDVSLNYLGWDIDVWIDDFPGQAWDGSSSTEISTAANWEGSVLPVNRYSSIYVPAGLSNYPILSNSSSPFYAYDMNIASGATFTYSTSEASHSLFIYGSLLINGTFSQTGNYYIQCEGGTSGNYASISGSGTYTTIRIDTGYNRLAYYKLLNSSTFYDFYVDNAQGNSIFDMNTYDFTS